MKTHRLLHTICAARWTLVRLDWTSSPVRNQNTTRTQICIHFKEDWAFEFSMDQMHRAVVSPALPVDPTDTNIHRELESRASNKRPCNVMSPTESTAPPPAKRQAVQTQTDILGDHLDRVTRKYCILIL